MTFGQVYIRKTSRADHLRNDLIRRRVHCRFQGRIYEVLPIRKRDRLLFILLLTLHRPVFYCHFHWMQKMITLACKIFFLIFSFSDLSLLSIGIVNGRGLP